MTSAPRSANCMVAHGPAPYCSTATTRTSRSGAGSEALGPGTFPAVLVSGGKVVSPSRHGSDRCDAWTLDELGWQVELLGRRLWAGAERREQDARRDVTRLARVASDDRYR